MTELSLKQFVPSKVCLQCDGCCRYKEADSSWRPKLGASDQKNLADILMAGDILDNKAYIKTIQSCGAHFCKFLNASDNTCGIYTKRPFECSLYPFVISQTPLARKLYVHLACPYIQDNQPKVEFENYVVYLKEFFFSDEIKAYLKRQESMFHDYSLWAPELLYLFDLSA